MKTKNNIPSDERFVSAQYIRDDGTIETYPNYVVSDYGRVGSLVDTHGNKRKVVKILKSRAYNRQGYMFVCLYINGKHRMRPIHRLVLSSFYLELWTKDMNETDHINRDPTDNRLVNLRWTDHNGNNANRSIGPVKQIRVTYLSDGHIELFDNMMDCSRAFGKNVLWCSKIIYKRDGLSKKYGILIEKIK